jgi:hypothetical protein
MYQQRISEAFPKSGFPTSLVDLSAIFISEEAGLKVEAIDVVFGPLLVKRQLMIL